MQLVFDIGNSSIKGGGFERGRLESFFTLPHDPASLSSGLEVELQRIGHVEQAGLASVVPDSTVRLQQALRSHGIEPVVVTHAMRLPFEMAYQTPETLGADRLAAAAAAWVTHGRGLDRAVVALDAGTAFTYDVVNSSGVYLGGTIAAGPVLMQRALNRETAQLPEVPLRLPTSPIGRSTLEAMQAGIMFGFVESVRGLLRRIHAALEEDTFVVATGGWRELLEDQLEEVHESDAHLVLRGVRILMEINR